MSCVPKKGSSLRKWFTNLAKELNVDEDFLEPRVHSFWQKYGEQKSVDGRDVANIPTAADMQQFFTGTNKVTSQAQIDLWNREYNKPFEFASIEEAEASITSFAEVFSPEAVILKKTSDGKYLVTVAKPELVQSESFSLQESSKPVTVEVHQGYWTRAEVEANPDKVYLFGDNTNDRVNTHHVPTSTQAVIRGLANALGIDTKKNRGTSTGVSVVPRGYEVEQSYDGKTNVLKFRTGSRGFHNLTNYYAFEDGKYYLSEERMDYSNDSWAYQWSEVKESNVPNSVREYYQPSENSYFTDEDFDVFKAQVDETIQKAVDSGKTIVLPADGIGTGKAMLAEKAPKCFAYLQEKLSSLKAQKAISVKEEKVQESIQQTSTQSLAQTNFEKHTYNIQEQVANLASNEVGLTSTEIQDIADECAYWLSDIITAFLDNPELWLSRAAFSSLRTTDNGIWSDEAKKADIEKVANMSRMDLVRFVGVENLLNFCKESLFNTDIRNCLNPNPKFKATNEELTDELLEQADFLYDNFKGLMLKASATFTELEKFSISYDSEKNSMEVNESVNVDQENFEKDSKDIDEVREEHGDSREHWSIDSRTIDVISSMSQLVRSVLTDCYQIDGFREDGSPIYRESRFGVPKRVDAKEAISQLLNWTRGSITYSDMIGKIKEKLKEKDGKPTENLWLTQLIDKLTIPSEGTPNPNTDFQSQFFGVLNKHMQPYSVVIKDDKTGKLKSIPVNEKPARSDAMNTIKASFKAHIAYLFEQGKGVKTSNGELTAFGDAIKTLKSLTEKITSEETFESAENKDEIASTIKGISAMLGYYITDDIAISALKNYKALTTIKEALDHIYTSLDRNKNNSEYDPFEIGTKKNPSDGIYGNLLNFLTPITESLEDVAVSSFYDSGKMYQSNVTPSYLTKLIDKFSLTGERFFKFLEEEYAQSEWFHIKGRDARIASSWINPWLRAMVKMSDEERNSIFQHKVQLSFNKHNYMRNMSDTEYAVSILAEYFKGHKKDNVAFYRIPIMSNKPSAEYISFLKYRGDFMPSNVTEEFSSAMFRGNGDLLEGFWNICSQEINRILTVKARENAGITGKDPRVIKNLDGRNGKKFMFLDFLNSYMEEGANSNTELGKLLTKKLNSEDVDENSLKEEVKKVVIQTMDERATQIINQWREQGIVDAAKNNGLINKDKNGDTLAEAALREFIWNDTFAAMNIMQLTITDMAQYKDAEDLQKRLAQLHAPGIRANVEATDYNGNAVSDGTSRTLYFTDFEDVISTIIDNVREVFQRKINQATTPAEKEAYTALMKSLVDEEKRDEKGNVIQEAGQFRKINVADAQAFCSMTSLRKKMFMFGKWSHEKEALYERIREGNYKFNELQEAFSQPLKPFVYSQTNVSSYVNGPISTFKVGNQNKNSEYLLIMADALLRNEKTSKPNLLKVISEVMEESHYDSNGNYKKDGIDTVQFESAVKVGLSGRIDLRKLSGLYDGFDMTTSEAEDKARELLEKSIYTNGSGSQYRPEYVKKLPYEDYSIQQEVPEHFLNHEQAFGSQARFIIPSDLETTNSRGEAVTYKYYDPALGKTVELNADDFKTAYEKVNAENIQESLKQLREELCLDSKKFTLKEMNLALSKVLQKEILSSPRYGVDLLLACSINKDGEFNIPLGDPIQSKRVEQLINSIIKNRVNKQKLPGGPVVQVSNFGASKRLNIRFYSDETGKDGKPKLLQTREEYKGEEPYEDYVNKHQRGIAHWEVFAPLSLRALFTDFADSNGNIDIAAIEAVNPDLLTMIGYRIPTEDKYSIIPMKIVGFLPREAGEGIMMPADVTLTTGSDFDVDKMYLAHKRIHIVRKDRKEVSDALFAAAKTSKAFEGRSNKYIGETVQMFLDNPQRMQNMNEETRALGYAYKRLGFKTVVPTEGREYRNNKIIDMMMAVLTEETTADKMLNPGGFDQQKRMGYLVQAKRQNPEITMEELQSKSISELKNLCYTQKNLSFIDTHVQFYKQNSAAASILGMFAVQKVAHAALEGNGYVIDVAGACEDLPTHYLTNEDGSIATDEKGNPIVLGCYMDIAGFRFGDKIEIDAPFDTSGTQRIGKTLGSLVGSAADAVKDPVLNLMNINSQTASVLNTLIRLGMPFDDVALLLSQKVIGDTLREFDSKNVISFVRLDEILNNKIKSLEDKYGFTNSVINSESFTREEMFDGLVSDDPRLQYKALKAYKYASEAAKAITGLTVATRFNSIASAVGPLIIDNLIMEHKESKFSPYIIDKKGNPITKVAEHKGVRPIDVILRDHPILESFEETLHEARTIFGTMPANSNGFRNILRLLETDEFNAYSDIIYNDRKLLSQLSDFYQSYVLSISGALDKIADNVGIGQNYRGLKYYIEQFPQDFIKYSSRYRGNALIDAIRLDVTKSSNRAILKVDTTGLDTRQKEKLSAAWADLFRENKKLATELFLYNFYRTGIGFSPKSFMSLFPTQIKTTEEFKPYTDVYRTLPSTVSSLVLDQFICSNADNSKLVSSVKDTKANFSELNTGILLLHKDGESKLDNKPYIKMKIKGITTIFKRAADRMDGTIVYKRKESLGNNKEYFEVSDTAITQSLENASVSEAISNIDYAQSSELLDVPSNDGMEASSTKSTTPSQSKLEELLIEVLKYNGIDKRTGLAKPRLSTEEAKAKRNKNQNAIREASDKFKTSMEASLKEYFKTSLTSMNMEFSEELINELYKQLC